MSTKFWGLRHPQNVEKIIHGKPLIDVDVQIAGQFTYGCVRETVHRHLRPFRNELGVMLKLPIKLSRNASQPLYDAVSECLFKLSFKTGLQFSANQARKFPPDERCELSGGRQVLVWVLLGLVI